MTEIKELRKWIIYMYTFPNGKRYIGKTYKSLKERQGLDWRNYIECPAVYRAYQKYKAIGIQEDILFENYMEDEAASRLEQICIALFKTNCQRYRNPSYGYNLTDGGDGVAGPRPDYRGGNHHSARSVYCIESDTYYSSIIEASDATGVNRTSIIFCCGGEQAHTGCALHGDIRHWLYAEDVNDKNIKRVLSLDPYEHLYTPVYCIELDKYFTSIRSAEEELNIIGITQVLRGQAHAAGRHSQTGELLHWLHADNVSEESIWNALNPPEVIYCGTEVYCIDLNLAFVSMSIPCQALGISRKTLRQCLNKEIDTAGLSPYDKSSLHWTLLSECENIDSIPILSEFKIDKFKQQIYCIELNMYFDGSRGAASFVHTSRNTLRDCLRGNRETAGFNPETGEPLHWKYTYNESFNKKNG